MIRTYTATSAFTLGESMIRPGTILAVQSQEEDNALRAAHLPRLRERPFGGWPAPEEAVAAPQPQPAPEPEAPKRRRGKAEETAE